jgi:hypothetical protein
MPGKWHNTMQEKFPKDRHEVGFISYSVNEKTEHRRTDVLLSNTHCLEIQHSYISQDDVGLRKKDWEKFGKTLVWLVDGNTSDVAIEHLSDSNIIISFFDPWKFKCFLHNSYEYILLEQNDRVYKVRLHDIKYKMVKVYKSYDIDFIVNYLIQTPETIWDVWEDSNTVPSRMIVHQKGAGNGKTYGIWKSILMNENKDQYIIVTKQHSAKSVIYHELNEQAERSEFHFENITDMKKKMLPKHYVVKYTHKHSQRQCIVIIGTIDSYIWNLTSQTNDVHGCDMFSGLLKNIIENGCNKIDSKGTIKFAQENPFQNIKSELWIDEAQDLNVDYFYAIRKLILQTGIDVNIIGDQLQSLEYKTNFMTEAFVQCDMPSITFIKPEIVNLNRRIKVTGMFEKINELVPFEDYKLPRIDIENKESLIVPEAPSFEIIDAPIIRSQNDKAQMQEFIDTLLDKVNHEADTHGYLPEDFMFIFPMMKSNVIAGELETRLNEFWISKFEDPKYLELTKNSHWNSHEHSNFTSYAYLHKHEEGVVIDLTNSEKATRLVTIRTSKGDGRNVVFVLNCTENALKTLSSQEKNIIYHSYLHVALTRAKRKMYFGLINNGDDICRKMNSLFNCKNRCLTLDKIKQHVTLNTVFKYATNEDNEEVFSQLKNKGGFYINQFFDTLHKDTQQNKSAESNDWKYHCMKHAITHFFIELLLIERSGKEMKGIDNKQQLVVILNKVCKLDTIVYPVKEFYNYLRQIPRDENIQSFPLCNISNKSIYKEYFKEIVQSIEKVKTKIQQRIFDDFTVYEMFLLDYMIDMYMKKQFVTCSPSDLYDITHYYKMREHNKVRALIDESGTIKELATRCLDEIYATSTSKIMWNLRKHNKFDGDETNFNLKCDYMYVGWDDKKTYHLTIENDISSINENSFILKTIFERFILFNSKSETDKSKFDNKPIITYVLLLKSGTYHKIDWTWETECRSALLEFLRKNIYKHYQLNHIKLFDYFEFVKTKKNEFFGKTLDSLTPFGYIYNELKLDKPPEYLLSFFEELDRNWKLKNTKWVKSITDDKNIFVATLDKRLNQVILDFLKMNEEIDEDF